MIRVASVLSGHQLKFSASGFANIGRRLCSRVERLRAAYARRIAASGKAGSGFKNKTGGRA